MQKEQGHIEGSATSIFPVGIEECTQIGLGKQQMLVIFFFFLTEVRF